MFVLLFNQLQWNNLKKKLEVGFEKANILIKLLVIFLSIILFGILAFFPVFMGYSLFTLIVMNRDFFRVILNQKYMSFLNVFLVSILNNFYGWAAFSICLLLVSLIKKEEIKVKGFDVFIYLISLSNRATNIFNSISSLTIIFIHYISRSKERNRRLEYMGFSDPNIVQKAFGYSIKITGADSGNKLIHFSRYSPTVEKLDIHEILEYIKAETPITSSIVEIAKKTINREEAIAMIQKEDPVIMIGLIDDKCVMFTKIRYNAEQGVRQAIMKFQSEILCNKFKMFIEEYDKRVREEIIDSELPLYIKEYIKRF